MKGECRVERYSTFANYLRTIYLYLNDVECRAVATFILIIICHYSKCRMNYHFILKAETIQFYNFCFFAYDF